MKLSANAFFSILGAATAGVIIGMLIAPEKGEDLRKNIRKTAGDLADKLKDAMAKGERQLADMEEDPEMEPAGEGARNGRA
ncbi:MAG TPA: YtxH domain-containing protein [Cyclobacteriaceae bacterium]|nr:YtxH domain-containing protein [Cyclobacteriaceae bacterium]